MIDSHGARSVGQQEVMVQDSARHSNRPAARGKPGCAFWAGSLHVMGLVRLDIDGMMKAGWGVMGPS
jgi:hypothetical protein